MHHNEKWIAIRNFRCRRSVVTRCDISLFNWASSFLFKRNTFWSYQCASFFELKITLQSTRVFIQAKAWRWFKLLLLLLKTQIGYLQLFWICCRWILLSSKNFCWIISPKGHTINIKISYNEWRRFEKNDFNILKLFALKSLNKNIKVLQIGKYLHSGFCLYSINIILYFIVNNLNWNSHSWHIQNIWCFLLLHKNNTQPFNWQLPCCLRKKTK